MNGDDRMGEGAEGQGTDVGQGGGLVLVLLVTRSSGDFVEQTGRTPTRTSTRPPHPLHPAPCPYRMRAGIFSHSPIRSSTFIRKFRYALMIHHDITEKTKTTGN